MIKEILFVYNSNKNNGGKARKRSITAMQSLSELYRLSLIIPYKNNKDNTDDHELPSDGYKYDEDQHRLVMNQILNKYPPPKQEENLPTHPHDTANIFTEYTYAYMLPLMRKGYKKAIELSDFTQPPKCLQLSYLYDQFLTYYTPKYKENCLFTFDVLRTIFRVQRWNCIKIVFCNVISELCEVGGVLAFRELVNFLYSSDPVWYGIALAVIIGLSKEFAYMFTARGWILGDRAGIGARNLLMGLIFRKSLLIPQYALINDKDENLSTGQIVNTMSNDTERINSMFKLGVVAVGCSLNIFICLSFMIWIIGVESMAGFAIGLLLVPFNIFFGKLIAVIKLKALTFSDERVKFLTEILNGIRVIKMYCWEKPLQATVRKWRNKEIDGFKSTYNARAFLTTVLSLTDYVIITAILSVKVWMDKPINVVEVYLVIQFTNTIRAALNKVQYINALIDGLVAVKRIQHFFDIKDYYQPSQRKKRSYYDDEMKEEDGVETLIEIKNADFAHEPGLELNKLIIDDLKIGSNELIAIIGAVGSGKSTLMDSLVKETHYSPRNSENSLFKFYKNNMKFAWINQSNFIMNGTIRENILMSNEFDIIDYNTVIKACSLVYDLKLFAAGDQTEIGEKGINLSGGQRARICIARALYEHQHNDDVDILLFDDSLSAVDNDVASNIFKESILGIGGNITTIVIMNSHLQFLKHFDRVLVMKYFDDENCCRLVEDTSDLSFLTTKYKGLLSRDSDDEMAENATNKEAEFIKEIEDYQHDQLKEALSRKNTMYDDDGESLLSLPTDGNIDMIQNEKKSALTKDEFEAMAKLITTEDRERGAIASSSLIEYLNNASSVITNGFVLFGLVFGYYMITQCVTVSFDIWLSWWGAAKDAEETDTQWEPFFDYKSKENEFWMNASWIFVGVILTVYFTRAMLLFNLALTASNQFEQGILFTVLHAPISYFDATPIGRITNRFSRDLTIIDSEMPVTMELISLRIMLFIGYVIVLTVFIPYYIILMIPSVIIIVYMRKFYIASTREIKRLDGITRSPIFNIFNECLFGLQTIRVYGYQNYFIDKFERNININSRTYFDFNIINRFFAVVLESVVCLQAIFISICVVLLRDELSPNIAALCITYATAFSGQFQYMIRLTADFENQLTAVERLHAFTKIEQEPKHYVAEKDDRLKKNNWPNDGKIEFRNLKLKYRKDLPYVLKGIDCVIPSGSKIGICGRTGAGKSSIMVTLFRLFEFDHDVEGDGILIDDVDISQIGLFRLRSNICIIPQEPVLLSGSLRFNLDPFEEYADDEIVESLKHVFLWDFVKEKEDGIYYQIAENGLNLSKGQRQLICISRALLKRPKILLLDEATSNIDYENDQLIQASIRNNFGGNDCTILTIAHRLDTIMDSDKIMVLDKGRLAEFDSPSNLLSDKNGIFYNLYNSSSSKN